MCAVCCRYFFFQAEDGIRYLVRSRGLGDVYKRQDESETSVELNFAVLKFKHTIKKKKKK